MYIGICLSQKFEDVINGLEDAWKFFEGVPKRVIVDNMKTAVTKAGRYESVFNREYANYAEHSRFEIDPAVPRKPTQKPKVERIVGYVRENFFKGEDWKSVDEVKEAARIWCRETAGKRVHGTTRKKPVEVYEMEEKMAMQPYDGEKYDPTTEVELTVRRDQTVMFDKALYTVNTKYTGKKVTVLANSSLVRIYYNCELIKTHKRVKPGEKQIDFNDYPEHKREYIKHDKESFLKKASEIGGYIEKYVNELLIGTEIWQKLRQCSKLFRIIEKYGEERIQDACRKSLDHEIVNVLRLEKILKEGTDDEKKEINKNKCSTNPEKLKFLRDMNSFMCAKSGSEELDYGNI
jgi:hypothetical protein